MTTVHRWTGREAKLLRESLRLSVRDFAARLGVGVLALAIHGVLGFDRRADSRKCS